jgi:hypothetical protein
MLNYLRLLQNPFVLGAIGGVIMMTMLYYDDSSNGNEIVIKDYLKLFMTSAVVVTMMIYISRFNITGLIGGSATAIAANMAVKHIGGGAVRGPAITEGMYAGMPDF